MMDQLFDKAVPIELSRPAFPTRLPTRFAQYVAGRRVLSIWPGQTQAGREEHMTDKPEGYLTNAVINAG